MKAAAFISVLASLALVAIPAEAQVPGAEVEGMTVSATTVDGVGAERGTETASITDIGDGLFEARPVDPFISFFSSAVIQYCDPANPTCTIGKFAPFSIPPGTWVASYYSFGVSRLVFDASASGVLFTGTANWLAQGGGPTTQNFGTFTFLNSIAGGYSQMRIDYVPALTDETPFFLEMETHDYGSTVPEPGTWVLMLTGILGIGFVTWRRREQDVAA